MSIELEHLVDKLSNTPNSIVFSRLLDPIAAVIDTSLAGMESVTRPDK